LSAKQFEDGTQWTFTYTASGQQDIVSLLDANQQIIDQYDYEYNERDWLVKRSDSIGGTERSISYTYDLAGNRTSTTTSSSTVFYTFDERNRLDTVIQNGLVLADYDYDANSRLITTTFGNGTQEIRQYDMLNRLTYLENHKGNTILSSYAHTLDKVGNRTQVVEHDGRTVDYSYDNLYRLTQEQITDSVNGDRASEFVYDKVGNRLIQSENIGGSITTTGYVYDANDRLLREVIGGQTAVSYSYDANGNTLSKQDGNGSTVYTWNDEGRLVGAIVLDSNGDTTNQMEYRYNQNGIRVVSSVDGEETYYLIDDSQAYVQVLEEYNNVGVLQIAYTHGNDLINQTKDGLTAFYLTDGLGSTRLLVDYQGNILDGYNYQAFGAIINHSGNSENKYLFAGEQYDSQLDQYYLRQRYYDTSLGRFSRRDSFEGINFSPVTLHKYLYADVNPANGTDPSGLFTLYELSVNMAIGAALNASVSAAVSGETSLGQVGKNLLFGALEGALFYGVASSALKLIARFGGGKVLTDVVGGVDKFLKSKIAPLSGSIAPGTSIPSQFMLKTRSLIDVVISSGANSVGSATGALKHVTGEILKRNGISGIANQAAHTRTAEAIALRELEEAVVQALAKGITPARKILVKTEHGQWELIFDFSYRHGTWKLYHAVFKGSV
jgi:RHS repeat-associated protein